MKFFLTLFFAATLAFAINAQTTNTQQQPAANTNQEAPAQKIAYEVIPAKKVVTPTVTVTEGQQADELSEIRQEQKQQKMQSGTPARRVTSQELKQQELQKKHQETYELKDEKPQE